jgi:hypothetical protein
MIQKFTGTSILMSNARTDNVTDYWNATIGNDLVKNTVSLNHFEKVIHPFISVIISKAVPLHVMETFGGRGGIAPTHS